VDIQQDLHIHTFRSNCGKPSNTVQAIIETLEKRNILLAGLTDHIDTVEQQPRFQTIAAANRADVSASPSPCRVLVGAEATMLSPQECALSSEMARRLDFVIVSCNHYHLAVVEKPKNPTPANYASHHLAMIRGAAQLGFVTIIAHPFLNDYCDVQLAKQTMKKYKEKELVETLQQLAKARVALEINPYRVVNALGWFKDLVVEGRRHGVKFSLGSDSHMLVRVGCPPEPIEDAKGNYTPQKVCDSIGLSPEDLIWPFLNPAAVA